MYNTDLPPPNELPSARKLLISTAWAVLIAAAILIAIVLPSEYGIDPTGVGQALGLKSMGEIKQALALEAAKESAASASPAAKPAPASPGVNSSAADTKAAAAIKQDTVSVTLKPGQAAEFKLDMRKDAKVQYEWTAAGGGVNFDTHGDRDSAPKISYHAYGKGVNRTSDSGSLVAAFDGNHGWFWRNRSQSEVTVTLKTHGDYAGIKRVL
jgi:hypothetical protein